MLKNYWWMIFTIPTLAFVLYVIARKIGSGDKFKTLAGMNMIGILIGVILICDYAINYPKIDLNFLLIGIATILVSVGRIILSIRKNKNGHKIK